jgi:hypothetical protein
MDATSFTLFVGWLILHAGALVWAWATRVVLGSWLELPMQIGFFAAMSGVAAAAWVCRQLDLAIWMVSAVTLMAMVLTAVIDFRRQTDPVESFNRISSR